MVALDDIDKKIINLLQADSRLSIREMANRLNLSTTPIFNRVKRLESEGVIRGYTATIDAEKVGKKLCAFVLISIKDHSKEAVDNIVTEVSKLPEVLECHYLTGGADVMLKVVTDDISVYNHFVTEKLFLVPNIGKIESLLSLQMTKTTNVIYLE